MAEWPGVLHRYHRLENEENCLTFLNWLCDYCGEIKKTVREGIE